MTGVHALVLAAGAGQRFGGGKMLARWRGEPLVRAAARTALALPVETATVVLGCDAAAVADALAPLAGPRLRLLVHEGWAGGISTSVRAGVQALPEGTRGAVVLLGDMPLVPGALAAAVVARLAAGAPAVLPHLDGRPAHPVGIGAVAFPLVRDQGDRGVRAALAALPGAVRLPTADPGAAFDVDVPGDLPPTGSHMLDTNRLYVD